MNPKTIFTLFALSLPALSATTKGYDSKSKWSLDVTLQFIRHGFSCGNVYQSCWGMCGGKLGPGASDITDPIMTDSGLVGTANASRLLAMASASLGNRYPDLVLTSALLRTSETALVTFPKKTVYQVPYVREYINNITYNMPRAISKQKKVLKAAGTNPSRLNFKYVSKWGDKSCKEKDMSSTTNLRCAEPSMTKFLGWLAGTLTGKDVPAEVTGKVAKREHITVSIFTHGLFLIYHALNKKNWTAADAPSNNFGYSAQFKLSFDGKTADLTRTDGELTAPFTPMAAAPGYRSPCLSGPPAKEYARCAIQWPKRFTEKVVTECKAAFNKTMSQAH